MKLLTLALSVFVLAAPVFAQSDEIPVSQITWHGSAPVGDWPITAKLDGIEWRPGAGVIPRYASGALNHWPDGTPPGWEGPLQFTLWACVKVPAWHCGGFMLFWRGRESTGAHWLEPAPDGPSKGLNNWQANWADARSATAYPPMSSYVPREGDEVAFLLAAGGNRVGEVFTVAQRTQIIKVKVHHAGIEWAAGVSSSGAGSTAGGGAGAGSGTGLPPPSPSPQPSPGPNVSSELNALVSLLTELSGQLERLSAQQDAKFEAARQQQAVDVDRMLQALQSRPVTSPQPVPLPDVQRIEQLLKERDSHGAGFYVMEILKSAGAIVGGLAAAGLLR